MAAGELKKRIRAMNIIRDKQVDLGYTAAVEDVDGNYPIRQYGTCRMSWSDFWAMLSSSEKSALGSIKNKMFAYLEQEEPWLDGAAEDDTL